MGLNTKESNKSERSSCFPQSKGRKARPASRRTLHHYEQKRSHWSRQDSRIALQTLSIFSFWEVTVLAISDERSPGTTKLERYYDHFQHFQQVSRDARERPGIVAHVSGSTSEDGSSRCTEDGSSRGTPKKNYII